MQMKGLGDKTGRSANVVVLGLLSVLEPFSRIPEGVWLAALMGVSANDFVKAANRRAFEAGRSLLNGQMGLS